MKVALAIDFLMQRGGAEWLLEVVHSSICPEADIFTLFYDPDQTREYFKNKSIITPSVLKKLPFAKRHWRKYLPIFPYAVRQFDLKRYDLLLSLSFLLVKGIKAPAGTKHICYCLTPMRQAYDEANREYRLFSRILWNYLRNWDIKTSVGPDRYLAISNTVAQRIKKYYNRDSEVIFPPADTDFFGSEDNASSSENSQEYFLAVSRLVPYKRVDLVVETFRRLTFPLKIVGVGREENRLKKLAKRGNIEFCGEVGKTELKSLYRNCRALICAQEEDFGISAAEAQVCGKPVISFAKGGGGEIVKDGETGILFPEQSVESLEQAVIRFLSMQFDSLKISKTAQERFNLQGFKNKLRQSIMSVS